MFEAVIFDLDPLGQAHILIEELNIAHRVKLKDDPSVTQVIHFHQELTTLLQLKDKKRKPSSHHSEEEEEKEEEELPTPVKNYEEMAKIIKNSYKLKVHDKVKVLVDTTTEFPLDVKLKLLSGILTT